MTDTTRRFNTFQYVYPSVSITPIKTYEIGKQHCGLNWQSPRQKVINYEEVVDSNRINSSESLGIQVVQWIEGNVANMINSLNVEMVR